jgi:hypothetical protein
MSSDFENKFAPEIRIDNRLESYQSFFDDAWIDTFFEISKRSRIDDAAIVLARDWLSASFSLQLVWTNVTFLESFYNGLIKRHPPLSQQLLTVLADDLSKQAKIRHMGRKAIKETLERRSVQLRDAMTSQPAFVAQRAWDELREHNQFSLGVWNVVRMAYGAVYHAYENFLQQGIEIGRSDPSYRAKNPEMRLRDFIPLFGQRLADNCITHDEVDTAKLVRNCLSHDGGRESDKLHKKSHGIPVVDGQLQIMPGHVRALFDLLKTRATEVAEQASECKEFEFPP